MYTYRYVLSDRYTYIFLTSFLPQVEKIWAKCLQQWKQRKRHARNSCKMCWKQGRNRLSTSVSSCLWWKCSLMIQPLPSALLLLCNSRNVEGSGWRRSLVEVLLLHRDSFIYLISGGGRKLQVCLVVPGFKARYPSSIQAAPALCSSVKVLQPPMSPYVVAYFH